MHAVAGGEFNASLSVNGSMLTNISSFANVSIDLDTSEKYVVVLGNSVGSTNATYTVRSLGTKTLPGVSMSKRYCCYPPSMIVQGKRLLDGARNCTVTCSICSAWVTL